MPDSEKKADDIQKIRLQSYLSHCGVASRRASEKIILDGRVTVNGIVVTELGTKVCEYDEVLVDGNQVKLEEIKRYVLLNKPAGYLSALSDDRGRPCAVELLKQKYSERLYNVGRLDMFSQGLLIFTNDGDFAKRLSHPSAELEKEYIVDTSTAIPRDLAESFEKGIRVDGVFYKCKKAEDVNARRMRIILIEGKNREIRNVFQARELGIKRLMRVRIGNIQIDGLKSGEFRELNQSEVAGLLRLCKDKQI